MRKLDLGEFFDLAVYKFITSQQQRYGLNDGTVKSLNYFLNLPEKKSTALLFSVDSTSS